MRAILFAAAQSRGPVNARQIVPGNVRLVALGEHDAPRAPTLGAKERPPSETAAPSSRTTVPTTWPCEVGMAVGEKRRVLREEAHAGLAWDAAGAFRDSVWGGAPTPNDSLHKHAARNLQERFDTCLPKRKGLRLYARKTIEQPTLLDAIRQRQAISHNANNHLVRYQIPSLHVGLCIKTNRGALNHSCTQHISGREMHKSIAFLEKLALSTFPGHWRAAYDDFELFCGRPAGYLRPAESDAVVGRDCMHLTVFV